MDAPIASTAPRTGREDEIPRGGALTRKLRVIGGATRALTDLNHIEPVRGWERLPPLIVVEVLIALFDLFWVRQAAGPHSRQLPGCRR